MKKILAALALASITTLASMAHAEVITVTTAQSAFDDGVLNQGWWSADPNFANSTFNDNNYTGNVDGTELRSFYTFDLSHIAGTITGATLRLASGGQSGPVALSLWDVTTAANILNGNDDYSAAIFSDLGSGNSYGSFAIPGSDNTDDILNLTLNAQALQDMISRGFFSMGATTDFENGQFIFSSGSGVASLVLQIELPEPSGLALTGLGLVGLLLHRRRTA